MRTSGPVRIMSGLMLLTFLSTIFAHCNKNDVEKADMRWAKAIASNHVNTVVDLYAKQAVLLATVENTPIVTQHGRVDYFTHFFNTYKNAQVTYNGNQYIQVFTGGAVSSGLYTFSGVKHGKPVSVPARYTFVYRSTTNGCELITHHSSQLPN